MAFTASLLQGFQERKEEVCMIRLSVLVTVLFSVLSFQTLQAKELDCGQKPSKRFDVLLKEIKPQVDTLASHVSTDLFPKKIDELRTQILQQKPTLPTEYLDPVYSYLICGLIKKDKVLKKDKDKEDKLKTCCDIKEYSLREIK